MTTRMLAIFLLQLSSCGSRQVLPQSDLPIFDRSVDSSLTPRADALDARSDFKSSQGWNNMASGVTNNLNGVWGLSAGDVFAVGDSGTILHYRDGVWSRMESHTTEPSLSGVWADAPDNVFAVGYLPGAPAGACLHLDGKTWSTSMTDTPGALSGVWGFSRNAVFAVGGHVSKLYPSIGDIWYYDGLIWSELLVVPNEPFSAIGGTGPTNIFAAGWNNVLHYDGTNWKPITPPSQCWNFRALWAGQAPHLYLACTKSGGPHGDTYQIILHFDGASWIETHYPSHEIFGIWGKTPEDVFAVGAGGTILHFDGMTWLSKSSGTTKPLNAIWGSPATGIFAVGEGGLILHHGS